MKSTQETLYECYKIFKKHFPVVEEQDNKTVHLTNKSKHWTQLLKEENEKLKNHFQKVYKYGGDKKL